MAGNILLLKNSQDTLVMAVAGKKGIEYYTLNGAPYDNAACENLTPFCCATGPQGPAGEPGESTYQIWLDEGNVGTEQDFLDSLVGAPGPEGVQGPAGLGESTLNNNSFPVMFDSPKIYGDFSQLIGFALGGNITEDLATSPKVGMVQQIYHQGASPPSFPSGWVNISDNSYVADGTTLNIIYAKYVGGSRVEYWIRQPV